MATQPAVKAAKAKYRKKVETLQLEIYPTDEDIKKRLAEIVTSGEKKAAYVKRLIREDIARNI